MTSQRKTWIKKFFGACIKDLNDKLKLVPKKDRIRIMTMCVKLGKYECIVFYDFKKERFTQIKVIEETIEL